MNHKTSLISQTLALVLGMLLSAVAIPAEEITPYPPFVAHYAATANGLGIGTVKVSLSLEDSGQYVYRQESASRGIAALFGSSRSSESSRWRFRDNTIQVLEYRSERRGGDADDNAHLIFDWEELRVRNTGAGEHWDIPLPADAIDRLVMQLAMLFDLREGKTVFKYRVPRQGRIKDYEFALVGEDTTELDSGSYRTLKVERTNDDRDQSWVWSAPDLDYFPVRFLKRKKNGMRMELVLRELEFTTQEQSREPAD